MDNVTDYNIAVFGNKVVASKTVGKKIVSGIATCMPEDSFDLNVGLALAKAKCDVKVEKKKMQDSDAILKKAKEDFLKAARVLDKARKKNEERAYSLGTAILTLSKMKEATRNEQV